MALRTGEKSENAGSASSSSHTKTVSTVPTEVAAKVAIRIAKLQKREDENLGQRFNRPGDHLWEVVNANTKWRQRYDEMSDKDKQELIPNGKSRILRRREIR